MQKPEIFNARLVVLQWVRLDPTSWLAPPFLIYVTICSTGSCDKTSTSLMDAMSPLNKFLPGHFSSKQGTSCPTSSFQHSAITFLKLPQIKAKCTLKSLASLSCISIKGESLFTFLLFNFIFYDLKVPIKLLASFPQFAGWMESKLNWESNYFFQEQELVAELLSRTTIQTNLGALPRGRAGFCRTSETTTKFLFFIQLLGKVGSKLR